MDAKDFVKKLKDIKAEVLAFKQYKKIGVGRADFPKIILTQPIQTTGVYNMRLTIEFENAATLPYMQFYARYTYMDLPGGNYTFQNNVYINEYEADMLFAEDYTIAIIATAPIKNATLEVV